MLSEQETDSVPDGGEGAVGAISLWEAGKRLRADYRTLQYLCQREGIVIVRDTDRTRTRLIAAAELGRLERVFKAWRDRPRLWPLKRKGRKTDPRTSL
jgi:hypothetical protein